MGESSNVLRGVGGCERRNFLAIKRVPPRREKCHPDEKSSFFLLVENVFTLLLLLSLEFHGRTTFL